ncbi:MAG: hypothetical protein MJ065_08965 [Oscillospiraceae bacterium]|nr:hypothetical protein [Oscillospiraceae bacterium]
MTERLIAELTSAFGRAGFCACPEYPHILRPIPRSAFFITAAVSELRSDEPLSDGCAAPVSVTLRLRYLWRPDCDSVAHIADADECLMRTVGDLQLCVTGMRRGAVSYQKNIDRLECETLLTLGGLLRREDDA